MSELRRLAVLGPISEMGGAEISLVELIKGLKGDPHVTVIVPSLGALSEAATRAGAAVICLPMPRRLERTGEVANSNALTSALLTIPQLLVFVVSLSLTLRKNHFDLVLTNGIKSHVTGTLAAAAARVPVAWHFRDSLEERPLSRRILSMLSLFASGSIAISEYVAREMGPTIRRRLKPSVIFNPVDRARFNGHAIPPADLAKPAGEVWFAIIGSITPLKGQDIFLNAAFIVLERGLNARFFIVGENSYATESESTFGADVAKLASRGPLNGKVRFLGSRTDIEQLLSAFDVIVHSNRGPEGLGRVILEAMSAGKAVVAFNHGGPGEIIQSGVTGELVDRGNIGALGARMVELGKDAGLRHRLGTAAQKWCERNLDADTIALRFRNELKKIVVNGDA